jgi:hypothetical protein
MKKVFVLGFLPLLLILSCNNKKFTHTEKNDDGTTTTTSYDATAVSDKAEGAQKRAEELKKLTPLTLEQLKAMLPASVGGVNRTDFNANSSMGYSFADANYRKDDSTSLKVSVYDCAGEAGSAMYALTFMTRMNIQQESARGYTKTVDFMGGRAIEEYDNDGKVSKLTFIASDRFMVSLEGQNMTVDAVKSAAKSLNLKTT